jgi:hypothetical protein
MCNNTSPPEHLNKRHSALVNKPKGVDNIYILFKLLLLYIFDNFDKLQ